MTGVGKNKRAPRNPYWQSGEIKAMYEAAKVSKRALLMVLHRHRRTSYDLAVKLELASEKVGKKIDRRIWLENLTSDHPAFRGGAVS